jgi:integrase/recombinase XerD
MGIKYLIFHCTYTEKLGEKTVKAYRIDLKQYFVFVVCEEQDKEKLEEYITELHKKYKHKQNRD